MSGGDIYDPAPGLDYLAAILDFDSERLDTLHDEDGLIEALASIAFAWGLRLYGSAPKLREVVISMRQDLDLDPLSSSPQEAAITT